MTEDAFVDSVSRLSFLAMSLLASATDIPLFVPILQTEYVHIQNAQKQTFLKESVLHPKNKDSFPDFFPRQRFFLVIVVSKTTFCSHVQCEPKVVTLEEKQKDI